MIAFEPYYDSYVANIAMAGGVRVPVTLRPPDFRPDLDELARAITERTRLILLNTPHNPTGTVFTRDELAAIAALAVERDLLVVTDEVYEHLVFEGEHVPIVSFPGMRERTVSISSAGKTFSFTGWKIGWVKATPELVSAVKTAKQFLTFVSGGPFQYAIAEALALPDEYYAVLRDDLKAQRDLFTARPGRARLRGPPAAGHLLRHSGHQRPHCTSTAPSSAGPARPRRRGGHPRGHLLRRPGRRPHPGQVRVLQAPRGPDRGPGAALRWPGLIRRTVQAKTFLPNGPALSTSARSRRRGGPSPTSVRGGRPLAVLGRDGQDGSRTGWKRSLRSCFSRLCWR